MFGIAVYVQDLERFTPERARALNDGMRAFGSRLEAVYALAWPDYPPEATPHPQTNRRIFGEWKARCPEVPLWAWVNCGPDQAATASWLRHSTVRSQAAGWLLDIEGEWTKEGQPLGTLIEGAKATGLPVRASLAGMTPAHVEYDYRTLDRHDVDVEWQAYFDSGEGTHPSVAVRELYRTSFVIGGWQYRHHVRGKYGWGKVGAIHRGIAEFDSYLHPGLANVTFAVSQSPVWGWNVGAGELHDRDGVKVGLLMGRARYENIRVALDVTRGAAAKHTPEEWAAIAGSARAVHASKRPVAVYLGEQAPDSVLLAIARGAA